MAERPRLYTKTGDAGETGLFDGTRVSKADPRVDAYGDVDELNAMLGVARTQAPAIASTRCSTASSAISSPSAPRSPTRAIASPARVVKAALGDDDVARLEGWIDELDAEVPPLRRFILAGGSMPGATLHLARTVCRRAERRIIALGPDATDPVTLVYVNRLSDLLFAMARAVNHRLGVPEVEW